MLDFVESKDFNRIYEVNVRNIFYKIKMYEKITDGI